MSQRVANLEANLALFDAIPDAAKAELRNELVPIAEQALALQEAGAPVRTGQLQRALTIAEELDKLRIRVGFPTLRGGRNPLFYAIPEEFGVKAGQKFVTRRGSRSYTMHWRDRPGRHFVHVEGRIDAIVDAITSRFWEKTLARAGAPE